MLSANTTDDSVDWAPSNATKHALVPMFYERVLWTYDPTTPTIAKKHFLKIIMHVLIIPFSREIVDSLLIFMFSCSFDITNYLTY